jgi:Phasin protein
MAGKSTDPVTAAAAEANQFFKFGQERTEAMATMQKELLEAYEQASRAWLARVKSEVEFWNELAAKLSASKSAPEAFETYRDSVTHRMQMAAEDGQRLMQDCQAVTQKITRSLSNGWPTQSS